MKFRQKISLWIVASLFLILLCGCDKPVEHVWCDTDGTVLHTGTEQEWDLPEDTPVWDYDGWETDWRTEPVRHTAARSLKTDYFVGNVFQIVVKDLNGEIIGAGSGFVLNRDGWFITNAHVMEDAYFAEAIFNIGRPEIGEAYTRLAIERAFLYDDKKDIFIGKLEGYEVIADSYREIKLTTEYELGEKTWSLGYPEASIDLIAAEGEVTQDTSTLYAKWMAGVKYVCSSSYITHGSSGGILINEDLEVLGITSGSILDAAGAITALISVSSYNFIQQVGSISDAKLSSLVDVVHPDMATFAKFYNAIKEYEETVYSDGYLIFEEEGDAINEDGEGYFYKNSYAIMPNGAMILQEEMYWENGDQRVQSLMGIYSERYGFADFSYYFGYKFSSGVGYELTSENVNYAENPSLSLMDGVVTPSKSFTVSEDNILYAKKLFNYYYVYWTELLDSYRIPFVTDITITDD